MDQPGDLTRGVSSLLDRPACDPEALPVLCCGRTGHVDGCGAEDAALVYDGAACVELNDDEDPPTNVPPRGCAEETFGAKLLADLGPLLVEPVAMPAATAAAAPAPGMPDITLGEAAGALLLLPASSELPPKILKNELAV